MVELRLVLLVGYALQALGAVTLAVVLRRYYRIYRHRYLLHWTWCWLAFALYLIGSGSALSLAQAGPPSSAPRLLAGAVALVAGYWQVVWLLAGTWELQRAREVPRRILRRALALCAAAALVTVAVAAALPPIWRA